MKQLRGTALAIVAVTLLSPAAVAQGPDARVLPRGMVELRVQGLYTRFDDRFGPGGTEPLGSGFSALIAEPAGRLAAAVTESARRRLEGFYARTQAATGGDAPLDLEPGTPRAALSADFRDVPATLAFGLTPRITVEVTARLQLLAGRGPAQRQIPAEGLAVPGVGAQQDLEIAIRGWIDPDGRAVQGQPAHDGAAPAYVAAGDHDDVDSFLDA